MTFAPFHETDSEETSGVENKVEGLRNFHIVDNDKEGLERTRKDCTDSLVNSNKNHRKILEEVLQIIILYFDVT